MSETAGQKIQRKFMGHLINAAEPSSAAPEYVRLGKGVEEMAVEMSANVEKTTDITGFTNVAVTKYEKSSSVEPYHTVVGDPLFARQQGIVDGDKVLDDCNTDVLHVKLWETPTSGAYPAVKEKAVIEIVSFGGDTTGYQIPFNLHYTGEKTMGYFNPTTKAFTVEVPTGG